MDFDLTKRVGLARFTADLDLFIEPTAENVARLRAALKAAVDDPAIDEISTDDLLGDYPAVQYNPPDATFRIDILTRLGDAYAFDDLKVQRIALDDVTVSVVTPQTLYEMKRDTVRLKHKADAQALKERFGLND